MQIFKIKLEVSAVAKGIDGVFVDGPLIEKTVNVKFYGKQEGILDISLDNLADYYLVLTGPKSAPKSSRGCSRPLIISNVYLFDIKKLVDILRKRGIKIGIATSVAKAYWSDAEIYPQLRNNILELDKQQVKLLNLFSS